MPSKLHRKAISVHFSQLVWSRHAQLEILNDKYGVLPCDKLPKDFHGDEWTLIELEADGEYIVKYVARRHVDLTRSLVIVIRPDDAVRSEGIATVVTAWTNLITDKHATLDRSKYATS